MKNEIEIGITDENVADFYFFAIERHTNSLKITHCQTNSPLK